MTDRTESEMKASVMFTGWEGWGVGGGGSAETKNGITKKVENRRSKRGLKYNDRGRE